MTHIDIFLILLFGVIILVISFAFSMLSELTGINHFFSWLKVQLISFAVRGKTTNSEKERQAIQETVEEQKNATYKIIDGPLKIQTEYENITIILNDKNFIEGKVLVGADGKNSVIREYANIQHISWRYKQTAIV